jgi:hypothetical protein
MSIRHGGGRFANVFIALKSQDPLMPGKASRGLLSFTS